MYLSGYAPSSYSGPQYSSSGPPGSGGYSSQFPPGGGPPQGGGYPPSGGGYHPRPQNSYPPGAAPGYPGTKEILSKLADIFYKISYGVFVLT